MKGSITVSVPKWYSKLMFGGAALLALVPVGFALAGQLPLVGAICFAIIIAPFVIAGIIWPRFRVTVRQDVVTVRPCFGSTWRFTIADVTKVVRRVPPNSEDGALSKMTVTACGRRVSVEALMRQSKAFWAFIEGNVSPDKIATKGRGRGRHEAQ